MKHPATFAGSAEAYVTAEELGNVLHLSAETLIIWSALEKHLTRYQKDPEAAKAAVHNGESAPPASFPEPELAAWTLVANLLLNLDETVTKN